MLPHTLYFIRHGETDWNAEGRLQGSKDIPLNDVGRVQAEEVGSHLAQKVARFEDLAYIASPLSRTRQTMEGLRMAAGLHPQGYKTDDRLVELAFGRWEGLTWKDVLAKDSAIATQRERDKWNTVPPDGESYEMLAARLSPFLQTIERDTVVVSHGGVGRALYALIAGRAKHKAADIYIRQGVIYVFRQGEATVMTPYAQDVV